MLIEKRKVGTGSTHANTGLLQIANDKSLTACMNTFGEENGVLFYRLCQQAMSRILELSGKLDIDPQIIERSSLLYASSPEDVAMLKLENENLIKHGFDSEFWDEEKVRSHYSFSKPAALYSRGDAETNPLRTVHSLIHKAHAGVSGSMSRPKPSIMSTTKTASSAIPRTDGSMRRMWSSPWGMRPRR